MHQIDDPAFNAFLRHAHAGSLTDTNVIILNNKVVKEFLLYDLLKNTIIVQKNKSKNMINRLQAKHFAHHTSRDFIIFLAYHSHNWKNRGRSIIHHDIIKIQEGAHGATSLGLLYYYKEMPNIVLTNICTLLEIINEATTIAYGFIPQPDSMLTILRWNQ